MNRAHPAPKDMDAMMKTGLEIKALLRNLAIAEENWSAAVALATLYGEFLNKNLLDDFGDLDFQKNISSKVPKVPLNRQLTGPVHYITEALETGGHTPLFKAVVNAHSKFGWQPVVVARRDSPALDSLHGSGISVYIIEEFEELLSCQVLGDLYLYSNPSDIEACIFADRVSKTGASIAFVNHADHAFGFQPTCEIHFIEVSGLGRSITSKYRQASSQSFLGIPIDMSDGHSTWSPSQGKFFLTIARREKLRPRDGADYPDFVNKITKKYKIPLVIFGQSGAEPWWGNYQENEYLDFRGFKKLDDILPLASTCTAYMDSFPLTGGTVLAMVGSVGAPIFSVKSMAYGYNATETTRKISIPDLEGCLDDFLVDGNLHYSLSEMSDSVMNSHSQQEFEKRLLRINLGEITDFPDWANTSDILISDVRNDFFSSLRFPFEISANIQLANRLAILTKVMRKLPYLNDVSFRSVAMSVLGQTGLMHREISRIQGLLRKLL